jgi:hypothetical protein
LQRGRPARSGPQRPAAASGPAKRQRLAAGGRPFVGAQLAPSLAHPRWPPAPTPAAAPRQVVEYGANWTLIADTLSTTSSIQGVNRRPEWCKARYAVLQKTPMEVGRALCCFWRGIGGSESS